MLAGRSDVVRLLALGLSLGGCAESARTFALDAQVGEYGGSGGDAEAEGERDAAGVVAEAGSDASLEAGEPLADADAGNVPDTAAPSDAGPVTGSDGSPGDSGTPAPDAACSACGAPRDGTSVCRSGACDFDCTPPAVRLGAVCRRPGAPAWIFVPGMGEAIVARGQHVVALDLPRNRMVVFGGQAIHGYLSDVWLLEHANGLDGSAATWVRVGASGGPGPRVRSAIAFDGALLTVYGGDMGWGTATRTGIVDDLWSLEIASATSAWQTRATVSSTGSGPGGRAWAVTGYEASSGLLLAGGVDATDNPTAEVWVLSNPSARRTAGRWSALMPFDGPPAGGGGATGAYDAVAHRLLVESRGELWSLEGAGGQTGSARWVQLRSTAAPPLRSFGALVLDPVTNRALLFGGEDVAGQKLGDLWMVDPASPGVGARTWLEIEPAGEAPAGRWGHTAVYDPESDRMIVFGGFKFGTTPTAETWILDHAFGLPGQRSADAGSSVPDGSPGAATLDAGPSMDARGAPDAVAAPDAAPPDAGLAPGTFACGPLICHEDREYCYHVSIVGQEDTFSCSGLPAQCGAHPTCACIPSSGPESICGQDANGAITEYWHPA